MVSMHMDTVHMSTVSMDTGRLIALHTHSRSAHAFSTLPFVFLSFSGNENEWEIAGLL